MENFIYQGEDFDLVLNCLNKMEPLEERVLKLLDIGVIIYTNKFDPILLSTTEEFGGKNTETGLIKLERDGHVLRAQIPSTQTSKLNIGSVCLEIKVRFPAGWKTIQKQNKVFQVKPCSIKSFEF